MGIPRGMGLRLEERIKVPKTRFDPFVGGHFLKAHFHQYLSKFGTDLEEGVEVASSDAFAECLEVVRFEGCGFPFARVEHFFG